VCINKTKFAFLLLLLSAAAVPVFSETENITHKMTSLVIQLGIIGFAAHLGGMAAKKIKMPGVLGELIAGIIIGPHLLGGFGFPGFPEGLFHVLHSELPVSPELYGIATIASIILLFLAGLETDLSLFLRFSMAGSIVGLGGVLFSFTLGDMLGMFLFKTSFMAPENLFLGVLSTATSVGITARILSDNRKMDSPEGVTILSAAVIDDVIGIILLAIIMGIVGHSGADGATDWGSIGIIALKAVGIWLGFTVLGLVFASKISGFLKMFKDFKAFGILSLALALLLAGLFEKAGLAMIIGAYVMGLTLSKTDISFVIQETLNPLYSFFVPVFFCVMGMLVNIEELMSAPVLAAGLLFSVIAVAAKIAGCGIPALFLNFNLLGAARIGVGMVPRGEVALIIAGIGLSAGILNEQLFATSIMMTLASTVIAPPVFNKLIKKEKSGTRKDVKGSTTVTTEYEIPSPEMAILLISRVTNTMENEGFFVSRMEMAADIYQMRKDNIFISMTYENNKLSLESDPEDLSLVKTAVYEALAEIFEGIEKLKTISKPDKFQSSIFNDNERIKTDFLSAIGQDCIVTELKSSTKEDIIKEMALILEKAGKIKAAEPVIPDLMNREKTMSTGMEKGIALPHAKSSSVKKLCAAIGIKKEGVDFKALDGGLSNIFILTLSPKDETGPHIQFLSTIASIFGKDTTRKKILEMKNKKEIYDYLKALK
jgi:fructose-specific phosphotransferase system IIA component